MSENIQRTTGRDQSYKIDRGGAPADTGPYAGVVKSNIDPARSGRLQVYIKEFGGDPNDDRSWRTVRYLTPFYGFTSPVDAGSGFGSFIGNRHTYGMWFTPPDIGIEVLCFFASGDPDKGYYVGCIPEDSINHMIPAIGADTNAFKENSQQETLFASAPRLPTVEINNRNTKIRNDARFFDQPKPVHAIVAAAMWQQGVITDPVRGPISSTSQRESPSSVYGVSSPGKPIYRSGVSEKDLKQQLDKGLLRSDQIEVVGRMGGHSFVMDDGDIEGNNALVRIRTTKGHQILFSDSGDCIHIIHANGQSWIELGNEGTLDVYATNSVNVRTNGSINLHADKDINMYAAGNISMESVNNTRIESLDTVELKAAGKITVHGENNLEVLLDGTISIKGATGACLDGGPQLDLNSSGTDGKVFLNTNGSLPVTELKPTVINKFPDVAFSPTEGWTASDKELESTVTRAPAHEPWALHNQGVEVSTSLSTPEETESPTPPAGWDVVAE